MTPAWLGRLGRLGVDEKTATRWAPIFEAHCTADKFSLGLGEIDDFLGQVLHESAMLTRTVENLRYTTGARIQAVWPTRFPTLESAEHYVGNPMALANKVYGGRMGNTEPNDGWDYRGRGLIMATGKDAYRLLSPALGVDLVKYPDELSKPHNALKSAIAWWEGRIPDAIMGDTVRVTRRVNGGTTGLKDRTHLTQLASTALGANNA